MDEGRQRTARQAPGFNHLYTRPRRKVAQDSAAGRRAHLYHTTSRGDATIAP